MKKISPQTSHVIHMSYDRHFCIRLLKSIVSVMLFSGLLFFISCSTQEAGAISEGEIAAIESGRAILVDVRSEEEFRLGSIAIAEHVPHKKILLGEVPLSWQKHQSLYLFCRSGRRSGLAADALRTQGFLSVHNLGAYQELKKRFEEQ